MESFFAFVNLLSQYERSRGIEPRRLIRYFPFADATGEMVKLQRAAQHPVSFVFAETNGIHQTFQTSRYIASPRHDIIDAPTLAHVCHMSCLSCLSSRGNAMRCVIHKPPCWNGHHQTLLVSTKLSKILSFWKVNTLKRYSVGF